MLQLVISDWTRPIVAMETSVTYHAIYCSSHSYTTAVSTGTGSDSSTGRRIRDTVYDFFFFLLFRGSDFVSFVKVILRGGLRIL